MPGTFQMMAPHPLDGVFALSRGGVESVIRSLEDNQSFVAAVEKGIAAELDQEASETGHAPHPGPGRGQSGRVAFLDALQGGGDFGNATPA